jgi:hypothetical protein
VPMLDGYMLKLHAALGCFMGAIWPVAPTSRAVSSPQATCRNNRGQINSAIIVRPVFREVNCENTIAHARASIACVVLVHQGLTNRSGGIRQPTRDR